jgi:chromosome partitioning protein
VIVKGYVLAVANMKGGVGKTATVVELSQALAADDPRNKILVIDVDAQASASFAIAGEDVLGSLIRDRRTIDSFLEDILIFNRPRSLADCIRRDVCSVYQGDFTLNISLIASSPPLRTVERGLIHALTRAKYDMERIEREMCGLIADELNTLRSQFDYIIFDCSPGISILTEAAIREADLVVVPTIPDFLSMLSLNAFRDNVWNQLVAAGNASGQRKARLLPHVLLTRRRLMKSHQVEPFYELPGVRCFETIIPESPRVPEALERTVMGYPTFSRLWGEITPLLQGLVREVKYNLHQHRMAAE